MEVDNLFSLPDGPQMARVIVRVMMAALLGALLGMERERAGKAAGLRTHMLVALGAALFVLFPAEAGMDLADLSRVIQGVATGIGFIGAGTILKRVESEQVAGLTTAASIWLTGAIGMSVGAGQLWLSAVTAVSAWVILYVFARLESREANGSNDADQAGRPVANAAIMLATADSPIGIPAFGGPSRTRTRDDGSFTIDGIPNGNYRLSAALPIVTKTAGAGIGRGAIRGSFSSGGGGGALMTETANGVTTEYRFDPAGEVRIAIQDDHVTGVQLIATSLQ